MISMSQSPYLRLFILILRPTQEIEFEAIQPTRTWTEEERGLTIGGAKVTSPSPYHS